MVPQIKICGLTQVDEAVKCAQLGADAIGMIFYEKSPRFIFGVQARKICDALPETVARIGVFVDKSFDSIMELVKASGLTGVQLHGQEPPELIDRLINENLLVIKGLFTDKTPNISDVTCFNASAYLVECGKGKLPGGNALAWNWSKALDFGKKYPMVLAGGLTPTNVLEAVEASWPDAIDVSSGVEISPGRKNIRKVQEFIQTAHSISNKYMLKKERYRKIFFV